MPIGQHKFRKSIQKINLTKQDEILLVPGILGIKLGGQKLVEVPNREGYVYVRLRDDLSELIQAYNEQVSPVYGLPVLVYRENNRYVIKGRDLGRYQNWGTSSYLPRHGAQHSFDPDAPGGDPVWVWGRQMMPLAAIPSGSSGAGNVIIEPSVYYRNSVWYYAGGTGTSSIVDYKPTGSNARMVLVWLDDDGNPQLTPGDDYFDPSMTGISQVINYVPGLPETSGIPLAGVMLVSGTSIVTWSNLYDLRPWIIGDGFIPTGTFGHIIQDDGSGLPNQPYLNFVGDGFEVYNSGNATIVSGTAAGGAVGTYITGSVLFGNADGSIDEDNANFFYDDTNDILFVGGNSLPFATAAKFVGIKDGGSSGLTFVSYGGLVSLAGYAAGGTEASPTALTKDQDIVWLSAVGYDGSNFVGEAWLRAKAREAWSPSARGTYWELYATHTGSTATPVVAYWDTDKAAVSGDFHATGTITASDLGLGVVTPETEFELNGVMTLDEVPTGSVGTPSTNKGALYLVDIGGTQTLKFKSDDDTEFDLAPISGLAFLDLDDTPTTYSGASGQFLAVKSDETGIEFTSAASLLTPSYQIEIDGTLVVASEVAHFVSIGTATIESVYIYCDDPGVTGTTIVDINKNGTTIFTTQANRPQLAYDDADGVAKSGTPDITDLAENDVITVDIDSVATDAKDLRVVIATSVEGIAVGSGGNGNKTYSDDYANRPISSNNGDVFFPHDGFVIERDDGNNWIPWGPIFPFSSPSLNDFTWINQGSGTAVETGGGIYLNSPSGGGGNLRILKKSAPSTPYSIISFMLPRMFKENYQKVGMIWRESSSGKLALFTFGDSASEIKIQRYDSPTSFNSTMQSVIPELVIHGLWMKIKDDGTNREYYWSVDGQNWEIIYTELSTDFISADEVGFFVESSASWGASTTLLHWLEE